MTSYNVSDRVMTVGYYRLPNWAYCENGLEHQNTTPLASARPVSTRWRALQNFEFSTCIQSHLVSTNCTEVIIANN